MSQKKDTGLNTKPWPILVDHYISRPIPEWDNINDLQGKLIGVTTGYSYTNELLNEGKRGTFGLDWAKTDKQNLARLMKGHIDAFPMSLIPAQYLLKTQFTQSQRNKLAYRAKALLSESAHLLFKKGSPYSEMYRQAFNKGLTEIKQNGVYDRLLKQLPHHSELITNQ